MSGGVIQNENDATATSLTLTSDVSMGFASEPTPVGANAYVRIALNGERYLPHVFRDGLYRAADPALGRVKHHSENQIAIRGAEIEGYLRRSFLLRMRGEISGQVNLIAASEIKIVR